MKMNILAVLFLGLMGVSALAEPLIQISPFAITTHGLQLPSESQNADAMILRRCVDDGGCRPGVERCIGGNCQGNYNPQPPRCHADRECAPLHCIGATCQ